MWLPFLVMVGQLVGGTVSSSPGSGRPRITHMVNGDDIIFKFRPPADYYRDLQYSDSYKTESMACAESSWFSEEEQFHWCEGSRYSAWSSWSQWTSWNSHQQLRAKKYPFTKMSVQARVRNSQYQVGDAATYSIDISAAEPGPVTNLQAHPESSNSIIVTWGMPRDVPPRGILDGYAITWRKGSRLYGNEVWFTASTPQYIRNFDPNQKYYIWVKAKNKNVPGYSSPRKASATTLEGVPSPVRYLKELHSTKNSLSVTWSVPAHQNGVVLNYEVSLARTGVTGVLLEKTTETSIQFNGLTKGTSYVVSVKACNLKKCSEPENMTVWTQTDQPIVEGELVQESSTATSIQVLLPAFTNPPGYQWLVLVNGSKELGETDDEVQEEVMERAGEQVCEELSPQQDSCSISHTNSSDSHHSESLTMRFSRNAHNEQVWQMEIIARIEKNASDNQEKVFVVGNNHTYEGYHNPPLLTGKKYSLLMVSQKTAGNNHKLKVSLPLVITAEAPTSACAVACAVLGALLLLMLIAVLLILLHHCKNQHQQKRKSCT